MPKLKNWDEVHPRWLWSEFALPDFVEDEVIDVYKTRTILTAFKTLGLTGVYIKPHNHFRSNKSEVYISCDKMLRQLILCPEEKAKITLDIGKDKSYWNLEKTEEPITWGIERYNITPYLNLKEREVNNNEN